MTTAYTSILKLALPVTGELSGTWGTTVNDSITSMVEQAIAGLATISSWTAAAHTLTTANGATSESRCAMLECSGAPGAAAQVICPTATKLYILKNGVTGGYAVTLKTSGGTGISVPNGTTAWLYCDGTNVVSATSYIASLSLGAALGVASGGTGLTSTPSNGQLMIGNGTGYTAATLTAGTNVTITNASGSITIAATGGSGGGTVTSVDGSGGSTGLTLAGGPITTSGTLTIGGTLVAASGGTGLTSPGTAGYVLTSTGSGWVSSPSTAGGTVTSVTGSGGSTGLTLTGGPITTSGTLTLGGTLAVGYGGTGLTSVGTSGNVLTSNGSAWVSSAPAAGALSSITAATGANTISSGDNAQTWKWTLTTASKNALALTENAAGTGGSGAQVLVNISTLATSTTVPLKATARGSTYGVVLDRFGQFGVGDVSSGGALGANFVVVPSGLGPASPIIFNGLPTSSAGLTSGMVWLNSNVLTIVP